MRTTKDDIKRWLKRGKENGSTHMIIVCDAFDYEDYPVYVKFNENVHEIESRYNLKNMQMVMEVYNLSMDFEKQLKEHRSFNR
jgi:hypothetical protein